jgi:predicted XRE-type DNA-binding protein
MNLSEAKVFSNSTTDANYEKALNLKIRSLLMTEIEDLIERNGWTQVEAAKRMGVNQPRISNLTCGKSEKFSIDMLIQMLVRAGQHVEVTVPKQQQQPVQTTQAQTEKVFSGVAAH